MSATRKQNFRAPSRRAMTAESLTSTVRLRRSGCDSFAKMTPRKADCMSRAATTCAPTSPAVAQQSPVAWLP
jgi:hypothetical protein